MVYFLSILSIFLVGFQEKGWALDNCSTKRTNVVINKEMNLPMSYCFVFLNGQVAGGYLLNPEYKDNPGVMDDNCSCNVTSAKNTISKYEEDKKPFYENLPPERTKDIDFLKLTESLMKAGEKKTVEKCQAEVIGETTLIGRPNAKLCRRKNSSGENIVVVKDEENCLKLDCDSSVHDKILFKGERTCQPFAITVTKKEIEKKGWKGELYLCRNYVEKSDFENYLIVENVKACDEWCALGNPPPKVSDSKLDKDIPRNTSSAPSAPAKSKKK